jgi:hypothetical protein
MPPQTTVRLKNLRSNLTLGELKQFFEKKYDSADVNNISLSPQNPTAGSPQVATISLKRTDQFYRALKPKQYREIGSLISDESQPFVAVDADFLGFTVLYNGQGDRDPEVEYVWFSLSLP